jgi:hypothetical protein
MSFEFADLDKLGRLSLLAEKKSAVGYWQSLHRLEGILIAYGNRTAEVLQEYTNAGGTGTLSKDLAKVSWQGQITIKKLRREMQKVDEYIKAIDARTDDGSRWMTAQDIANLSNL